MKVLLDNIKIKALSSWLPKKEQRMSDLSGIFGQTEVDTIIRTTGIDSVRVADELTCSSDMCLKAAEFLIDKEQIDKSMIDGLIFVSQTPDYTIPSTSVILQSRLGLSKDVVCIDIRYGCSGYIYGLFQASLWISTGACKNVLLLAGDTSTKMINPNDRSLRMVFGDCGTATYITYGNNKIGFRIQSDGSGAEKLIIPAGGYRMPIAEITSQLEWDENHNGRTKNDLYMDGMAIFNFAVTNVHKNINELIEDVKWNKEEIGLFALHQANEFMVNIIRKKLKVNEKVVPTNCKSFGNTGPASIPLLLCDKCTSNKFVLDKVIMSGFGIGLSWGSVAANLSETNFYKPINI